MFFFYDLLQRCECIVLTVIYFLNLIELDFLNDLSNCFMFIIYEINGYNKYIGHK